MRDSGASQSKREMEDNALEYQVLQSLIRNAGFRVCS